MWFEQDTLVRMATRAHAGCDAVKRGPSRRKAGDRQAASAIFLLAAALLFAVTGANAFPAKNVLLFIADGASWGTWDMASYYEFGERGQQPYDRFSVKLGVTTSPLTLSKVPTREATSTIGYDPAKAWDATPEKGLLGISPGSFAGYEYVRRNATDSAAAATALATGSRTYNSAINYDNFGQPLPYATRHAKECGRATGVVTSVPFSHATPAAFGAQSRERDAFHAISEAMISNQSLDLIMGAGHPLFDANGKARLIPDYLFMSETAWRSVTSDNSPRTLIQTKEEFEALAQGRRPLRGPLLGLAQVGDTLQASRTPTAMGPDPKRPSGTAMVDSVPSLETMTRGALRVLGANARGFFLMVEGGAVDWGAHAHDAGRTIEEQIDFNRSVRAAVEWVERNSNWDESLLIVVTDHGNGLPLGPESDEVAFQRVKNQGRGKLPLVKWQARSHTNEITLLWAHGAGASRLYEDVVGVDKALVDIVEHNTDGRYIANTAVGRLLLGKGCGEAPRSEKSDELTTFRGSIGVGVFSGRPQYPYVPQ